MKTYPLGKKQNMDEVIAAFKTKPPNSGWRKLFSLRFLKNLFTKKRTPVCSFTKSGKCGLYDYLVTNYWEGDAPPPIQSNENGGNI